MQLPIYFDNQSTTVCHPLVVEAVLPFLTDNYGNPSSDHYHGHRAFVEVEKARSFIAAACGREKEDVIFTSGATEAINLAVDGILNATSEVGEVICLSIEHLAMIKALKRYEQKGWKIKWLPIGSDGIARLEVLDSLLSPKTRLICLMGANNEIGTVQPVQDLFRKTLSSNCHVLVDLSQGFFWHDYSSLKNAIFVLSGHKIYGPKGVGALLLSSDLFPNNFVSNYIGGGQERGLRPGTLNVPAIVGFSKAVELAQKDREHNYHYVGGLQKRLYEKLCLVKGFHLNATMACRLPCNLNFRIDGIENSALLLMIKDKISLSTGAACSTSAVEPSHVLKALSLNDDDIFASVRVGLGIFNTLEEVDFASETLIEAISELRKL